MGDQGHVHIQDIARSPVELELADGLQKRKRFDVPDGAADLHDGHIHPLGIFQDLGLDLVGDVRNHLHGSAEIVAAAFFLDNGKIDLTRSEVASLGELGIGVPLVVPQIQVGLGAVIGDENLSVLERGHGTGINVDIGIKFLHRDPQATGLKQCAQGRRGKPLAD